MKRQKWIWKEMYQKVPKRERKEMGKKWNEKFSPNCAAKVSFWTLAEFTITTLRNVTWYHMIT